MPEVFRASLQQLTARRAFARDTGILPGDIQSLQSPAVFEVPAATLITAVPGASLNHTLVDGTRRQIRMGLKLIW